MKDLIELSTTCITEEDNKILDGMAMYHADTFFIPPVRMYSNYGYGYIIGSLDSSELEEEIDQLREQGFSEDGFIAVMRYAFENKAKLVQLDCDIDNWPDKLKNHDW
ncbi:MAG: hypothetical protein COB67_02305 [SAR324 cluster bacterium]|uniref:DUF5983 domain-containing protein n=1 Tax=SAR324 cluster bacterium TaxID=2024889 RepID=A0A2A4T9D0_9DELT|nr:MAG: hypothetical protein COB67_02305 [SAR324 cluster bacterium]